MKVRLIVIPILLVIFDQASAQLNLPDMPGPPYPDKFGNNRWGVKYDPKLHGRGRGNSVYSSPSSSSGNWGGDGPQYSPSLRYREQRPQSSRSKWASALKPLALVSRSRFSKNKNKRNRRPGGPKKPSYNPTSDSSYQDPYSNNNAVDSYVQSYLDTYQKVVQVPPGSNIDLERIQNYARPSNAGRHRRRQFVRNGNRRSLTSGISRSGNSSGSSGSLTDSYLKAVEMSGNDKDSLTLNPQDSFFGPKITKKKSEFAKTLSTLYNDYKPDGENADSGIETESGKTNPVSASATDNHDNALLPDDDSFITRPLSASRGRVRQYASGNPPLLERPTRCGDGPCPPGPPTYRRPRPPSPPPQRGRYPPSRPLSSLDHVDDDIFSFNGSPFDDDSPTHFHSDGPGSTVSLSGYMPGPPPPYFSFDSEPGTLKRPSSSSMSSPYTASVSGNPTTQVVTMQMNPVAQVASMQMTPAVAQLASVQVAPLRYIPAPSFLNPSADALTKALSTLANEGKDKERKNKPKKKRLQHTPVNVLRGLLGHDKRDRQREQWRQREREREEKRAIERERDTFKQAFAANIASFALPQTIAVAPQTVAVTQPQTTATSAPPQYTPNPVVNSIHGVADYNRHFYSAGPPPPAPYSDYPFPPPPPPPHMMSPLGGFNPLSPLASGLSALRDTITGIRERPYRYPPYPPPPPPPRYRPPSTERETTSESKKEVSIPIMCTFARNFNSFNCLIVVFPDCDGRGDYNGTNHSASSRLAKNFHRNGHKR